MRRTSLLAVFAIALTSTMAAAEETENPLPERGFFGVWAGDLAFGFSRTTGNTEQQNLSGMFQVTSESQKWKQLFYIDYLNNSTEDESTANRVFTRLQSNYKVTQRGYVFGTASYDRDKFSGYEYQATGTVGYGHRVVDLEKFLLNLEVGGGYRQSESDTDETESTAIGRGALDFSWLISETSKFTQRIVVEPGQDNTTTRSESVLDVAIYGNLGVKLAYILKHNSEVPPDTENLDTELSVLLAYKF